MIKPSWISYLLGWTLILSLLSITPIYAGTGSNSDTSENDRGARQVLQDEANQASDSSDTDESSESGSEIPTEEPGTTKRSDSGGVGSNESQVSYESFTNFPGMGRISNLCQLTTSVWYLGFAILFISVVGSILYGGLLYTSAGVNIAQVNQAKGVIQNAFIGLVLGLSIVIILQTIDPNLLSGDCEIESIEPFNYSAPTSPAGGSGVVPDAGQPCQEGDSSLKCITPGEVSAVTITSCFYRNSGGGFHAGTDWVVSGAGNPVAAMTAGEVVKVCTGNCGGFGNTVTLRGPSQGGYDLYNYSHMSSIAAGIQEGMTVGRGTILGVMGNTGYSFGAHVDTKISNCTLCKSQGSHFTKPSQTIKQYLEQTYGVSVTCNCRNGCNDT